MNNSGTVRVRFAPSPTGPLHMGGVRTALYNYLFARKNKGTFVLRIEDTDQSRYVEGAEKYIMESLKWCGIQPDESVENPGKYGPYRQSERKEIYKKYALQLVESGNAYYAFDTAEELDAMRSKLEEQKAPNLSYAGHIRGEMKNSLNMSKEELEAKLNAGEPYVIRFKMPENEVVESEDIVRGTVKVNTNTLDDKVLFKSDGMPTYHLANVVDDYLMEITHVIRGEEWLPSLTLHSLLYRELGFEDKKPKFAHLSLLLKPTGKGKLSKRDGDKMGFPVFPLEWKTGEGEIFAGYKENGYFPEAFINILALLGWNPGTEQEIFSLKELESAFDLNRVSKSGARFDPEKSKWFNHQYLMQKSNEEIYDLFLPIIKGKGFEPTKETVLKAIAITKEKVSFVKDLWEHCFFLVAKPESYHEKTIRKKWKEDSADILKEVKEVFKSIEPFERDNIEVKFKKWLESKELGFGQVMPQLRLVLTGLDKGSDLFEIISIIGIQETSVRIDEGILKVQEMKESM